MITDRFGRYIASGCYYELFEDIPCGEENAIYQYQLADRLKYDFGISPLKEIKRVINDMYCDGYIIMRTGRRNRGKYYRIKDTDELVRHFGETGAASIIQDTFYKV